ncbi:hypothetical protein ACT4UT_36795, partial [Bacillus sp. B-TM1]
EEPFFSSKRSVSENKSTNASGTERFDEKKGSSAELDEALEALRALGYAEREVSRVVPELLKESLTTEHLWP